ncbi:MAG: hypothetical protein HKN26_07510 [Acidimicrobiales bacterium]|nr:hypothetical protein [Acidimicrobiales bacterium]
MILGPDGRYLFIQVPHTASTAIAAELVENYGGRPILDKHTTIMEFVNSEYAQTNGNKTEIGVTFAGVRDPFDQQITFFTKLKTGHDGLLDDKQHELGEGGHVTGRMRKKRDVIRAEDLDYAAFLKRFYKLPIDAYGCTRLTQFDDIVRHETIQQDFERIITAAGFDHLRPIPQKNKSARDGSAADRFEEYYPPHVRQHAANVLGPLALTWGYELDERLPAPAPWAMPAYRLVAAARNQLQWNDGPLARGIATLRRRINY